MIDPRLIKGHVSIDEPYPGLTVKRMPKDIDTIYELRYVSPLYTEGFTDMNFSYREHEVLSLDDTNKSKGRSYIIDIGDEIPGLIPMEKYETEEYYSLPLDTPAKSFYFASREERLKFAKKLIDEIRVLIEETHKHTMYDIKQTQRRLEREG